ncbi:PRP3-domain-containing protein [Neoconidiobolus thromboides FSU 785]|nr:PRP3-domain-containing protein [Neoconidiobolus thromboides FSU 785]
MSKKPNADEIAIQHKKLLERIKNSQNLINPSNYGAPRPPPLNTTNTNFVPRQPLGTPSLVSNQVRPGGIRPLAPQGVLSSAELQKKILEGQKLKETILQRKKEIESRTAEPKIKGGLNMQLHPLLAQIGKKIDQETITNFIPRNKFVTAKANQKQTSKPAVKEVEKPKEEEKESITKNPYFDPELGMQYAVPKPRLNRSFKFNEQGKWIERGNQVRAEAMVEKLREQIAARAKAAGMEEELELVSDKVLKRDPAPEVEWWDREFFAQPALGIERVFDYNKLEFEERNGVTNLIHHPVEIKPPFEKRKVVSKPLMLTKQERKKLRRQRRAEELKEKQEKIRLGLLPPEQTKVKLSNLMRVLASETVENPTQIEAQVRSQVADRKREHEKQNEERKLTDEQRREKIRKKAVEDVRQNGLLSLVFKVRNLDSKQHKFKVDKNATQNQLSGMGILNNNFCLIVVEGGPKGIKRYKKLMLRRIQWDESSSDPDSANYCHLVWEGEIHSRQFKGFSFKPCPTDSIVRQTLSKFKAEHYWDLAKSLKHDYVIFEPNHL